jgi:hypothetical protein
MDLQAVMTPQAPEKVPDEPGKYSRRVEYRIGANQVLTGVFTFKDMTLGQQAEYEIRRARLAQGVAFECLAPEAQELFAAVALLGMVLEKSPDWYDKTGASPLIKPDLILALAAAYWEWQQSTFQARAGDGETTEGKPTVVMGPVGSEGIGSKG